ncbi:MAG TPA: hypothetical protein VGI40_20425, partial [Pirellulaceae bacterium]
MVGRRELRSLVPPYGTRTLALFMREDLEGRAIGARESAGDGQGWRVVGREEVGDLVGVKVRDDGTVGVVHGVVPAVVGWKRRPFFVVRVDGDQFFVLVCREETEGESAVGLAEQGFDPVRDDRGAVAVKEHLLFVFGMVMLAGEPGEDAFAGK